MKIKIRGDFKNETNTSYSYRRDDRHGGRCLNTGTVAHVEDNPLLNQRNDEANFIIRQPFHLPSPHISPVHMLQLKELIEKECKNQKIDGVVITHGTDTMEETAYFLDLTVQVDVPMVVTGAMRSSNEIGSEGLANFMAAIRVASYR